MANNRLYIVNTTTGKRALIAKYYPSTGWYAHLSAAEIDLVLSGSGDDVGYDSRKGPVGCFKLEFEIEDDSNAR